MSTRSPWLRPRTGGTVPFGATLKRSNPGPAQSWPAGSPDPSTATRPTSSTCPGCHELTTALADLTRARAEAVAAGRTEGRAETEALRAALTAAATGLSRAAATRDHAVTELIVDVALGLCAELAPAAAAIDRRGLAQLVIRALRDAGADTPGRPRELVLRMCADDVALVGSQLPGDVTCEVGPELVHGEVWVEAPRLVVDGRWAPRLAALREPLLALVRAAEPAFELATDQDQGDEP